MAKDRKMGDEIWVVKFDEESAQNFRDSLIDASRMDPTRPIVVYIDSYGGQVDSLAKMIETMDEVQNPIVTVAMGKAMSCGAILLSHGDYRMCGKHSRIMVHEVSGGTSGDVHDVHADTLELKRLNRHFLGLLAKNCGLDGGYDSLRKLIKSRDGRDLYLDASAALKFGVVDKIGLPKVESMLIHSVALAPVKKIVKQRAPQNKPETPAASTPVKNTKSDQNKKRAKKNGK